MGDGGYSPSLVPRLCHIVKWPEFNGYGFNLHAEKGKAGQFIGKVDEGSPAEAAGLKAGDRIVEVNGTNIGNENHQQVVGRVKAGGEETRLLVVDQETDLHYKEEKKVVRSDLPEVKFLTAARDERNEMPEVEASVPAAVIEDTNGPEPEPQVLSEDSSQYAPRLCHLCKWPDFEGYGFNLHAEKDKPGQYIGTVDPNSPAETGGMKEGDRIIEVNGDNIETSVHSVVIQKIKSGGDKTTMLVVDKATDDYYKDRGQTVISSMSNVLVISTPPRLTVMDTCIEDQTSDPDQVDSGAVDITSASFVQESQVWDDAVVDTSLPEPTVSLSDTEEMEGSVTAMVTQTVQSAPAPDEPEPFHNGTEEMTAGLAAMAVVADYDVVVAAEEQREFGGEVEREVGGELDLNLYEQVEVTATPTTTTPTTTTLSYEDDMGSATNGINGGSTTEWQSQAAVVSKTSEPEPTVIGSTTVTTTSTTSASGMDLDLNLSAAEMKERLRARKKQDPRQSKASFESKYKMFEKM